MNPINLTEAQSYLSSLLSSSSSKESLSWLDQKIEKLAHNFSEKDFYLAFSMLPRFFEKEKIKLTTEQLQKASQLREGFIPSEFTIVQTARIFLVLHIPADDTNRFLKILNNLFTTGEVNELVALYSAVPLLPHPELLKARAAEGIRTSMTVVFDSVALNNPYPSDYLDDDAWNQMVLKAVFMERPLERIYGLDKRANKELAKMLSDYAHERWAASRYVTPELWRPVGPFIDDYLMRDIERLFEQGSELEKQAATLAVKSSSFLKAREKLFNLPQLKSGAENTAFDWHTISKKWFEEKNRMTSL